MKCECLVDRNWLHRMCKGGLRSREMTVGILNFDAARFAGVWVFGTVLSSHSGSSSPFHSRCCQVKLQMKLQLHTKHVYIDNGLRGEWYCCNLT